MGEQLRLQSTWNQCWNAYSERASTSLYSVWRLYWETLAQSTYYGHHKSLYQVPSPSDTQTQQQQLQLGTDCVVP